MIDTNELGYMKGEKNRLKENPVEFSLRFRKGLKG